MSEAEIETLREKITMAMEKNGDGWINLVGENHPPGMMEAVFTEGWNQALSWSDTCLRFTVWTRDHVYFPIEYDGLQAVASVPRNPSTNPEDAMEAPHEYR